MSSDGSSSYCLLFSPAVLLWSVAAVMPAFSCRASCTEMPTYLGRRPICFYDATPFARGRRCSVHKAKLIGGLHSDEKYIAKMSTPAHPFTCQECRMEVKKNNVVEEMVKRFQETVQGEPFLSVAPYNFVRRQSRKNGGTEEFILVQERQTKKGKFGEFVSPAGESRVDTHGVLEAFGHFSYDFSCGEVVVAGLKGVMEGRRPPWKVCTLTSVTLHSLQQRFGVEDEGANGIQTFFANHSCTPLCQNFRPYCVMRNRPWNCNPVVEPSAPLLEDFSTSCYPDNQRSVLPPPYSEMNNNNYNGVTQPPFCVYYY